MNYWDSVGRWINTLLMFIVGVIGFDTLFRLLDANESNVIVSVVRLLSLMFLVPFAGMFGDQDFVLTALMAVLGYAVLVGIALGVLRSMQATRSPRHSPNQAPQLHANRPSSATPAPPRRPQAQRSTPQPARTSTRPAAAPRATTTAPTATAPTATPPKAAANGKAQSPNTQNANTADRAQKPADEAKSDAKPPETTNGKPAGSTASRAASKSRGKG